MMRLPATYTRQTDQTYWFLSHTMPKGHLDLFPFISEFSTPLVPCSAWPGSALSDYVPLHLYITLYTVASLQFVE